MLDGETPGYIGRAEENRRRNLPDTGEKGRASRRGWPWMPPWRRAQSKRPELNVRSGSVLIFPLFHPYSQHMINITPTELRRAANLQEKIQSLQKELSQILGGNVSTHAGEAEAPRTKRKVSAAGRARMRAAQKARWAKIKGKAPSAEPGPKPKVKRSAAWRAAVSASAKARWAIAKKAGKTTL